MARRPRPTVREIRHLETIRDGLLADLDLARAVATDLSAQLSAQKADHDHAQEIINQQAADLVRITTERETARHACGAAEQRANGLDAALKVSRADYAKATEQAIEERDRRIAAEEAASFLTGHNGQLQSQIDGLRRITDDANRKRNIEADRYQSLLIVVRDLVDHRLEG